MPPSFHPGTRWRALDVFRGLTIAGMILVNAADLGGHAYHFLQHAYWNGCTFADSVFPAFLFIMGVAMGVSLQNQVRLSGTVRRIYPRILRRTVVLFVLGLALNGLFAQSLEELRIMGVLQRLALCYLFSAVILLHLPRRAQIAVIVGLLVGHSLALKYVHVPALPDDDSPLANNLAAYIDRQVLGASHLLHDPPYLGRVDPEGLLGTLTAIPNVLFGAMAGRFLAREPVSSATALSLAGAGVRALLAGFLVALVIPINKALWTSSFTLATTGVAVLGLAVCYEIVDVLGVVAPARPFEVMGQNAIAAYLLSTALDALLVRVRIEIGGDAHTLYDLGVHVLSLPAPLASVAFALLETLIMVGIAYAMHARGLFLKV